MSENQILSGFEKANQIDQILHSEGKKIFKLAFSSPGKGRTKAERRLLFDLWKIRKQQIISALEASQSIPELKIPNFDKKTDFWKKSKLRPKNKIAIRNAKRNKLIKKYGLFAHKHQNEK